MLTQILIHRWGPRARISALFRRCLSRRLIRKCGVYSRITKTRNSLVIYSSKENKLFLSWHHSVQHSSTTSRLEKGGRYHCVGPWGRWKRETLPPRLSSHKALRKHYFHWPLKTHLLLYIRTSTCVSKWKLGRHKHKHKHKKNAGTSSFFLCLCLCLCRTLTSENWVDISTSIRTRPWTNHRSLWPRPHANISKAIWRKKRSPSCLLSGWGELISRIESNMLSNILGMLMSFSLCLRTSENQA